MNYVIFDAAGKLLGAFDQDLNTGHAANYIEVTEAQRREWTKYKANAARNGLDLAPAPAYDLAAARATLITRIDVDVDAVYAAVVGNRSNEYNAANADAAAYKAASYTGTVPPSVQSWATAKGWTAQAAADDILAAAARLASLRDTIRAQRLGKKEAARVAVDKAALDAVAAQWATALASIRTSAGL